MHKTRKQSRQRQLVLLSITWYFHIWNMDISDTTGLYQVWKRSFITDALPCSDIPIYQLNQALKLSTTTISGHRPD